MQICVKEVNSSESTGMASFTVSGLDLSGVEALLMEYEGKGIRYQKTPQPWSSYCLMIAGPKLVMEEIKARVDKYSDQLKDECRKMDEAVDNQVVTDSFISRKNVVSDDADLVITPCQTLFFFWTKYKVTGPRKKVEAFTRRWE